MNKKQDLLCTLFPFGQRAVRSDGLTFLNDCAQSNVVEIGAGCARQSFGLVANDEWVCRLGTLRGLSLAALKKSVLPEEVLPVEVACGCVPTHQGAVLRLRNLQTADGHKRCGYARRLLTWVLARVAADGAMVALLADPLDKSLDVSSAEYRKEVAFIGDLRAPVKTGAVKG